MKPCIKYFIMGLLLSSMPLCVVLGNAPEKIAIILQASDDGDNNDV